MYLFKMHNYVQHVCVCVSGAKQPAKFAFM